MESRQGSVRQRGPSLMDLGEPRPPLLDVGLPP